MLTGHGIAEFGLQTSGAYLQSKGKDIEGEGDEDNMKYGDVDASYYFNKNMRALAEDKINLLDENAFTRSAGNSTDGIVALGPIFQFRSHNMRRTRTGVIAGRN